MNEYNFAIYPITTYVMHKNLYNKINNNNNKTNNSNNNNNNNKRKKNI